MSHFGVLTCVPGDTDLSKLEDVLGDILAPWDEGLEVQPYRRHEDGSPGDFWWVRSVRRGAELHHAGGGLDAEDRRSALASRPPATVEEKRAEYAEDARWAERLGERPTWGDVVRLYNEKYHPGNEVAPVGDTSDSERLHYEPESDRAYTWSTYNPESKWDYWRIGGRWAGHFVAKQMVADLVFSARGWDSPKPADDGLLRCDGGRLSLLDLDAMRDVAAREAHARYDKWEAISAETPSAKPWSHFGGLAELKEITLDEARRRYHSQPRVERAHRDEEFRWGECVIDEFLPPRDEYVAEARRGAVPGYALVTLDREWVAPGRMGWFGMSSDGPGERSGYCVAVNSYLDQLDPATFVVVVDCHI
jgi:hypothetical protein